MNTQDRILTAINKFNDDNDGQVNLGSTYAREDLAELIYNAVMKQMNDQTVSETYNTQEMFNFTNKDTQ